MALRDNLAGAVVRLVVFLVVCAFGTVALLMIFAQFRLQQDQPYHAEFTNASGLKNGDFVRIAGVEVGQIKHLLVNQNALAIVEFSADDSVVLTEGTRAIVRYDNLIGGRYLELQEGTGGTRRLPPGGTIPVDRTAPALDLDALIGGFRPLFRALNPDQVNALTGQLVQAFQGQGEAIGSFLAQTASLTNTLADRDELIGEVIANLNTVLGSVGKETKQFDKAVDSLSELVKGLAERKTDISNAVAYSNAAGATVSDLLAQARPPAKNTVSQLDRVSGLAAGDHEYLDKLLDGLPDVYQALSRQGIYGSYFAFYFCDVILKLNGKGGQPVYVKVVGQDTGRCARK
jgi:phospholipid/cholesterol/gamma-HCH transport system substrate-binding protein